MPTNAMRAFDDNGGPGFRGKERPVGWLLFEVFIALAIAIGIVWWTFPKSASRAAPPDDGDPPR